MDRSSVNAFDDERVARAIEATGRKKLIFAGVSFEVCAAFPAIIAVGKGLDAYVAVDASGTFSETKRQVGLLRMLLASCAERCRSQPKGSPADISRRSLRNCIQLLSCHDLSCRTTLSGHGRLPQC